MPLKIPGELISLNELCQIIIASLRHPFILLCATINGDAITFIAKKCRQDDCAIRSRRDTSKEVTIIHVKSDDEIHGIMWVKYHRKKRLFFLLLFIYWSNRFNKFLRVMLLKWCKIRENVNFLLLFSPVSHFDGESFALPNNILRLSERNYSSFL